MKIVDWDFFIFVVLIWFCWGFFVLFIYLSRYMKNIHQSGPILAVYCVRLSHAITCPFSKYFQILYIFTQIFKYLALSCLILTFFTCPFLPFSWKIACMSLLSRIGPASKTNGNLKDIRWTSLCLVLLYYCKDWRDEEQSA